MAVRFVGIDPDTDRDHCPTVWADAEAQEILLQGWKPDAATHAACQMASPAHGPVPEGEAIIRLPARMIPLIREACDAIERAQLR
ncbi:hypothetical protein SSP24_72990 [Streptomyces spinoverrucosus]|uniref:Uncharacterized protein n=1 Tax=Streptomyces spinoverrucosus TaxID=284043 RepID=A0A4Y3VRQ6_9ACTN|nr:hypothetical protein [Streptomyces spinoverrucosus]GEC09644.1 hypothetical protein SSP24_72990 [Streptomyces spinoverrucosus]GHB70584.1 hypothetical protein GCM10010397_46080 [Streptomyces spinoverrucosus]